MRFKFDDKVIVGLRQRYKHVHPLVVLRSFERAKSPGDAFDILESVPEFPFRWDADKHCWIKTDDLMQLSSYDDFRKANEQQ